MVRPRGHSYFTQSSTCMQIQQDFGINVPGGLALSIDKYRLALCSSTAVLRDDDVLSVSLSSGAEASLQVSA